MSLLFLFPITICGYHVYISSGEVSGEKLAHWYLNKLRDKHGEVTWTHDANNDLSAGFIGISRFYDKAKSLMHAYTARKQQAQAEEYDEIVLIDLPLVNLSLLGALSSTTTAKITYIAPPEMWLWGRWGLDKFLSAYADTVVVIFPFEKILYEQWGMRNISFLGFPYLNEYGAADLLPKKENKVLLMPGSRQGEIDTMMPILAQVIHRLHSDDESLEFALPLARESTRERIVSYLETYNISSYVTIVSNQSDKQKAYQTSICAITKPGTSTLELALSGVPMVITCKVSWPIYYLCKAIILSPFVGLPNLIAQKEIVPELMQHHCCAQNIYEKVRIIIDRYHHNYEQYSKECARLQNIRQQLI